MKLKTRCNCGGKIVNHDSSPITFYFCDKCLKVYSLNDLRIIEPSKEEYKRTVEHEHELVCKKCGILVKYNESLC